MGRKTPDSSPSRNGGYYDNNNDKTSSRYRSRSRERHLNERVRSQSPSPYIKKRRGRRTPSYDSKSPEYKSQSRRGQQDNPPPSRCIGIFGMNIHTKESQIREIFSKFGSISRITMIYCAQTGRSRGFCFVYYKRIEDAVTAKEHCNGMEIHDRRIRVDFSITERAHSPTPGAYMGRPVNRSRYRGNNERNDNSYRRRYETSGHRSRRQRSYSRSPSYEKTSKRRKRHYDSRSQSRS